jgi:hypothetical protein
LTNNVTESPVAHLVTYKRVPTEAHSDVAFRMIQSWLNKCVQSHRNCPNTSCSSTKYGATLLPTRVVDVGPADESEEPRLCIPGDAKSNSNPGIYENYRPQLLLGQVSRRRSLLYDNFFES